MENPGVVVEHWTCEEYGHINGPLTARCRVCKENRPCNMCGSREGVQGYTYGPRCPEHKGNFGHYYQRLTNEGL